MAAVALGTIHLRSSQLLPYHRDAIGTDWASVEPGTRVVLRALIHAGGGGWVAAGVAPVALAVVPVRRDEAWAEVLAPVVGLLIRVPDLWASLEVTTETEAVAPLLPRRRRRVRPEGSRRGSGRRAGGRGSYDPPVPVYEYRCLECEGVFERHSSFHDADLARCPQGHARVKRLLSLFSGGRAAAPSGGGGCCGGACGCG